MMKKLISISCCLLFAIAFFTVTDTSKVTVKASNTIIHSNVINWDEVTEVTVIHDNGVNLGEDDPVYQAKLRGITIKYDLQPASRYSHYNKLVWITRSGIVSLSMYPKEPYMIQKEPVWQEATRYFQNHPIYTSISNSTKYSSMYNQFVCHADYAYIADFKVVWNIEPATPDKGYWGVANFKDKCN